jgi:hypothetical protein
MSQAATIALVDDDSLDVVRNAPYGILVLTKTTCGACASYQLEIETLLARGDLDGSSVAKLVLDRPGGHRFKRDNPWLASVQFLPYTVLYRDGQQVDAFAASKASYLLERLADVQALKP